MLHLEPKGVDRTGLDDDATEIEIAMVNETNVHES